MTKRGKFMRSLVPAIAGAGFAALALGGCLPRAGASDPVFKAVSQNDVTAVNSYLLKGGDVNMTNRDGETLLYVAAGAHGGLEVAARLVAAGADPELGNRSGRTPLLNALGWCDVDMVSLLLSAGARVEAVSEPEAANAACDSPIDRRDKVLALIKNARR